jgi:large subunit ribosomal protein L23
MEEHAIIKRVQATEKGTALAEKNNQYILEVAKGANKIEIKRMVEKMFGVSVLNVNTMIVQGKRKRERTARYGKRPDWKRAIVSLKEGDKISAT